MPNISSKVLFTTQDNGGTYTAPANGWFSATINEVSKQANWNLNGFCQGVGNTAYGWGVAMPVHKGDTPSLWYSASKSSMIVNFYYNDGEI